MSHSLTKLASEALAYEALNRKVADEVCHANDIIQSIGSFCDIGLSGISSGERISLYEVNVHDVVLRRRGMLHRIGITPTAAFIHRGRVLATDLTSSMYDGVAGLLAGGYFDDADVPPPSTWLDLRIEGGKSPGDEAGRVLLISWVQMADVDRVVAAIAGTPSGCLSWVENWWTLDASLTCQET